MKKIRILILSFFILLHSSAFAETQQIYVFAAASLTDAMQELSEEFSRREAAEVFLNLAGSNTLRLQIEKGVPCDVYFSANEDNVNRLMEKDFIVDDATTMLLQNRLVVITHQNNPVAIEDLRGLAGQKNGLLSIADPETVPSGIYAKEALITVGIWEQITENIIPALDVRAALLQVENGNVDWGIVYQTDMTKAKNIRKVYDISPDLHPPILYPVSLMRNSENVELAQKFINFLKTETAHEIFQRHGFTVIN